QLRIGPGNEMRRLEARQSYRLPLSYPDASYSWQYRAGALFPTWAPPGLLGSILVGWSRETGLPVRQFQCFDNFNVSTIPARRVRADRARPGGCMLPRADR